ncbi:MAG: 3-hydroxy-3-methylglutaryl-CoA lyase [Candidatus Galacturonibacter soehngenii]|nr:3-hydroxy-3-methylglutaryl-CoA lyase [Candidatus Galacturonibacter soehngenii]
MSNIGILDCTLRDGGYVNDWEFGHNNLISIYERLVDSGVEVIEVGFLDDRRPFDINRSIMPDTESVEKIWGQAKKKPPMVVGMIDYGTCKLENIQPCEESYLDGIRVIFKKHIMKEAMEYCAKIKEKGYKVFSQLVSITSYNDEELLELVKLVNEVEPYAVSIVDTYGLLHPEDLLHYYQILDDNVKSHIQIGYHAHNNFQLAYANVIAFMEKDSKHDILVDATLYGMGKSAGNAPLELVTMYLNEKRGTQYKINSMMEAIEESVMDFFEKSPWGYKMFFYMSAANKCHPNYVSYLQKKANLSLSKLNTLLDRIEPEEKKLLYDKDIVEGIYDDYMSQESNDKAAIEKLGEVFAKRSLLLVGPGKNIQLQGKVVADYIEKEKPLVISINYIPGAIPVDYVFTTNRKRYQQMTDSLHEYKNKNVEIIATSNVECMSGKFEYSINREPLLEKNEKIEDNSFLMLLKVLRKAGVKKITCAGFDGYSKKEDNYFNPKMEYYFVKDAAEQLNSHIKEAISETSKEMQVDFLTYSQYTQVEDSYDAAF